LEKAIIWHPAGEDVLVYEPLDRQTDAIRYDWVVGIPHDWRVVPANVIGDQHLLWMNTDSRLWRSEINEDGEQILGVLPVGGFNVLDYGAISLTDELTLMWWQSINGISKAVYIVVVDQRGRPLGQRQLLPDADQFTLTMQLGRVYLTWTTESTDGYSLHYAEIPVNELLRVENVETSGMSLQISTEVGEWIDSLQIIVDIQEITVIWGIMGIDSPDHADFQGVVWKRSGSSVEPTTFELHIENDDTKLRWVGRIDSQPNISRSQLVLNAFLGGKWRAILVEIDKGDVASYEVISDVEANASATHIWISEEGHITAAWARIQGQSVVQEMVSNRPDLLSQLEAEVSANSSFGESLLEWFLSLPYGVLWLLFPIAMLIGFENNRVIVPSLQAVLILIAYWIGKSLVHGEVLNTPPSFDYTDSDVVAVGVALGSSALVAGAIAQRIWSMDVDWRTVLMVFLIGDMIMTYLIFGANLG
jgi:hypothetical protein